MAILIVSETIPPDYSGAGTSALLIANHFYARNQLAGLVTRTERALDRDNIPENLIIRCSILREAELRATRSKGKKLLLTILIFPYLIFSSFLIVLKYRNRYNSLFLISYSWFSFFITVFSKLIGKKLFIETTLLGQDDPIHYRSSKYKLPKKIMKNFLFKNAEAVTNISTGLAEQCVKFGIPLERIKVIPRTADESKFFPINQQDQDVLKGKLDIDINAYPVLLFCGVLNERKGIDIVYETYKKLQKVYPKILLLLAGSSHANETVKRIDKDIVQERDQINLLKLGLIDNVHEYMKVSDILFFPSRNEGFGRVFIEAMACGLPVICKSIPGVTSNIFNNGNNGIFLDSDDDKNFKKEIINLLNDKNKYSLIRENSIETYKNVFSNEVVFEQYMELIPGNSKLY